MYVLLHRLDEVLARQHCSPISLTDLENYLAYVRAVISSWTRIDHLTQTEHSAENLRFTLCMQAYAAEHAGLAQSDSTVAPSVSDSVAAYKDLH